MAFCSKVDYSVHLFFLHQGIDSIEIADIHLDKAEIGLTLDILKISEVPGISEAVKAKDAVIGILVHEQAYNMAAYESGAACNDYASFHFSSISFKRYCPY